MSIGVVSIMPMNPALNLLRCDRKSLEGFGLSYESRPTLMPDAGVPTNAIWLRHDRTQGESRNATLVPAGEMVALVIKQRDGMSLGGAAQCR